MIRQIALTGLSLLMSAACALAEDPERFGVHGSNTIGAKLMPRLVEEFGRGLGYKTSRIGMATPEEVEIRLSRPDGAPSGSVEIRSHGSGTAVPGLISRAARIGMSSRPVTDAEIESLKQAGLPDIRQAGYEHVLALDGLAVVVSPDNPVSALSLDQIARIFSGTIKDWGEIGGAPGPIFIYARDAKSGTYDTFDSLVLRPAKLKLAETARRLESSEDLSDSVARDAGAIGFIGFAYIRNARALAITTACGVTTSPTIFDVKTEEYPLARRLFLYTAVPVTDDVASRLVRFSLSDETDAIIRDEGFIDLLPSLTPGKGQLSRVATSLAIQGDDFDATAFKQLVATLRNSQRVSSTFRFVSKSTSLDSRTMADIDRLARWLRPLLQQDPKLSVALVGFTDASGTPELNLQLSQRRADTIKQMLAARLGPALATRVVARAHGDQLPVACNSTADGRDRNRRVEVWLEPMRKTQESRAQ